MNLYLRYFDKETLVHNVDDAIDFLASIDEIGMNPILEEDIRDYVASDVYYPKRYKIRPRVYFIIIKTEAATMLDFKEKVPLGAYLTIVVGDGLEHTEIMPNTLATDSMGLQRQQQTTGAADESWF